MMLYDIYESSSPNYLGQEDFLFYLYVKSEKHNIELISTARP